MMDQPPPVVIYDNRGGVVIDYWRQAQQIMQLGMRVEIRGLCASACTLILAHDNVCVTRDAMLMFHQATDHPSMQKNHFWTKMLYLAYPEGIQQWIDRHGGLTEKDLWMSGEVAARFIPECDKEKGP